MSAFYDAVARGEEEQALRVFNGYTGVQRRAIADEREAVARTFLSTQIDRLYDELERGDCAAVHERLQRLARLLPDRSIPGDMSRCSERRH